MRVLSLRAWLLLGFLIAMPVLALPAVARRVDEFLYGPPPSDFGRPEAPPPVHEPIPSHAVQQVAPAGFLTDDQGLDDQGPAAAHLAPHAGSPTGLDVAASTPPPLAPVPTFVPLVPPQPSDATPPAIDEQTIARLQQIRDRLEQLGADYILVETTGNGRYRFHCRMLVDGRSSFARPFESTSADPLAAGEEVLRAVEAWRAAGAAPQP